MNFSEFAKLMHNYIGTKKDQQEFVPYLLALVMHDPISEEDIELDEKDEYYPYSKASGKSASGKVYSGIDNRNLPVAIAKFVNGHFEKSKLVDAVYELEYDTKENLCSALHEHGISCDVDNVDEVVAMILGKIIEARARGENQYFLVENEKFDKSGQKIDKVPLATAYCQNGKLHIGESEIELPIQLVLTDQIESHEQPYIKALFEAYANVLGVDSVGKDDIERLKPSLRANYSTQRKAYYAAESIRRSIREVYEDSEKQFEILKEDAYEGIQETYFDDHEDGLKRLNEVLKKITSTTLNKSVLMQIANLIGNLEKKGICHILVNDNKIKSWVDIDV